ncbi:MAG: LytR/AlgR family response regulator transcription factor [Saprospiraceae bacterium]
MRILILEDELPAYHKLLGFVQSEISDANIQWARSVEEAKLLLKTSAHPDLIFSDIELLDGVSFEVYENIQVNCPIIFCTGFDKYVLKAFQTNGIAYLLKPYDLEAFKEAYAKYKKLFVKEDSNQSIDQQVIKELKAILHSDKKEYKQRFTFKKKDGIKIIDTKDIACFEANGDFSMAVDEKGHRYPINFTLSDLEKKIDPSLFFRINRSQVININFIDKIESHFKNRLSVRMTYGGDPLISSSGKTPEFRKWLDG